MRGTRVVIHLSMCSYEAMYREKAGVNWSPLASYLKRFFAIFF